MYIKQLRLHSLKLIRDVEISFTRGAEPRMWTILVGENGLCKTTILQAIALAASGPDRSNQLADIGSLADRRNPKTTTHIGARFCFGAAQGALREYPGLGKGFQPCPQVDCQLRIEPGWKVFKGSSRYSFESPIIMNANAEPLRDPLATARATGLPYWFVAGYGTARSLPLPKTIEQFQDHVLERLASLFDRGRIVGTNFAELFEDQLLVDSYNRALRKALFSQPGMLPNIKEPLRFNGQRKGAGTGKKSLPEFHRFTFQAGDRAVDIPSTWLSQGYQATISWISDLVGQLLWESGQAIDLDQMEGLVLIDELDLHLHPMWQVNLIRALKATFPKIQFVATTHSPMLLPSLDRDEILHVRLDQGGNVIVEPAEQSPALMTGSEIYQSFFGIDRLYPSDQGEALNRYGYLSSDPDRTDAEEQEMLRLQTKLQNAGIDPGWEPTPRKKRRPDTRRKRP